MTKLEEVAKALDTWETCAVDPLHWGVRNDAMTIIPCVSVEHANAYRNLLNARAALVALRKPTPEMLDAGEGFNIRCGCPNCDHTAWEKIELGWQAMIDVLLGEAK